MTQQTEMSTTRQEPKGTIPLLIALSLPFLAGLIGGMATGQSVKSWYPTLRKPRWTPPGALFGPVWTLLYLLMGAASWLVWWTGQVDDREEEARGALSWYGFHLFLNALWSVIFFGWRRVGLALLEIGAVWATLQVVFVRFRQVNPVAAALLVPYELWATFAALLNGAIWWLNRRRAIG